MAKPVENWDDDDEFGDIDESNFLISSVSSAGGVGQEGFFQRPVTASQSSNHVDRMASLNRMTRNIDFDDDFNDNYENDFSGLTTKISKLDLKRISSSGGSGGGKSTIGTVKKLGEYYGGAFKDDDELFLDEGDVQTVRVSSKSKPMISIRNDDFYKPPQDEKKNKKNISFDDNEFQFDDDVNLADRLNRVKTRRGEVFPSTIDDTLDDSFRTDSRLSTYSLSTSATTYTDNEDEDFGFSKEEGDLFDKPFILQKRLENVRHQNEIESERDREFLSKGKKYDTIRSNGSGNSIKGDDTITSKMLEDFDEEEELLNGFELNDDIFSKGTLHKNVVVKVHGRPKRTPREVQSTADFNNRQLSQVDDNTIRIKKSMPVLRPPNRRSSSGRNIINSTASSPQKLRQLHSQDRKISNSSPTKIPPQSHRYNSNTITPSSRVDSRRSDFIEDDEFGNITIDATSTVALKPGATLMPKRLRPVQSMLNITQPRPFTKPRRGPIFEQNVLDQFDDLNVDVDRENKFSVTPKGKGHPYHGTITSIKHDPIDTYREKIPKKKVKKESQPSNPSTARSPTKSSLLKDNSQKKRTPKRKGLGLIRNLGNPTPEETNGMHFNPTKLLWEGNDIELKKFDSVNPKTPGLIAFISNKGQQVVGDMIFDPDKLCWINTNEDNSDPFEGLDDLEVSTAAKQTNKSAISAAVQAAENLANSIGGEFTIGNEFNLSSKFIEKLQHDDEKWTRKTKPWLFSNEDIDREYLYEIRSMVMRR